MVFIVSDVETTINVRGDGMFDIDNPSDDKAKIEEFIQIPVSDIHEVIAILEKM